MPETQQSSVGSRFAGNRTPEVEGGRTSQAVEGSTLLKTAKPPQGVMTFTSEIPSVAIGK